MEEILTSPEALEEFSKSVGILSIGKLIRVLKSLLPAAGLFFLGFYLSLYASSTSQPSLIHTHKLRERSHQLKTH